MKNYLKLTLFGLAALTAAQAWAVPARPGIVQVEQPDGTRVAATLHGDEYHNWISTPDGYTLLRDDAGFLTFACRKGSKVVASDLRYTGAESLGKAAARGIAKDLRPAAEPKNALAKASATQIEGTFPSKGKHKLLMLLLNYADTQPKYTQQDFSNLMNAKNYKGIGSFRDYYLENSYGELDIETVVTKWYTLAGRQSDYGSNGAQKMIIEALDALDAEIDLTEFDNDGDGVLDGLAVIHQGTGAEATGSSNEIWSHSGSIMGISYDGVRLSRYTIEPELLDNSISTIGVICHEFGHNLGAPDFYDTDYSSSGGEFPATGDWDLMGSGAWNGNGDRPAGTNMWQKIQLGWVTPEILTADKDITGMKSSTYNPVAYRFDTTVPGEYFVLENRQKEGQFDSAIPHHGLLIYHVNDNMIADRVLSNDLNVTFPQSIYLVCAGATEEPSANPNSFGWVNTGYAPYPGVTGKTSFTDTTVPSTKSMSGRYTYKGLTHIAENTDGTVDFKFVTYETPASPANLTVTSRRGRIDLSWEHPAGERPVKYNVYRNDELLATVTEPGYTDATPGSLTDITYSVDAEYASTLVSPCAYARLAVPRNHITELSATVDGEDVSLQWNLNTRLSRMPEINDNFVMRDYPYSTVEIAHRFRAEDLAIYRDYSISHISFVPVQSQREVQCTLTVYEVDPASGERTVASQRAIKEHGASTWNKIKLTKNVKITGEKDLWIAVKFVANTASVQTLVDLGPAVDGYGNLVRYNDGEWETDVRTDGNMFLYATLVEPDAAEGSAPDIQPVSEAGVDTDLPAGFAIYRGDELVGTTDGRKFTDTAVPAGTHTYSVTNIYKGDNESNSIDREVLVGTDGITAVETAPAAEPTEYYNIQGQRVTNPSAGLYITPQGKVIK